MEFIYDFFSTSKGQICVVDIIHNISGKGKGGIMVCKFIGLLKNGMEYDGIKGLIWKQNTRKKPQILLKIVTSLSENS